MLTYEQALAETEDQRVLLRTMLAALYVADEAMAHRNGYHDTLTAITIRAAIAQAEAAGIKGKG